MMTVAPATTMIVEIGPRPRATEATHPIKIVTTGVVVLAAAAVDVAEKVRRALAANVPPELALRPPATPLPLGHPSPDAIAEAVHAARPIAERQIAIASRDEDSPLLVGHPIAGQHLPDGLNAPRNNPRAAAVAVIVAASAAPPVNGRPASCRTLRSPPGMSWVNWNC